MIRQAAAGSAAGTAAEVAGMAVLAAAVAALAAIAYRWLAADRIQEGLAVLVGLAASATGWPSKPRS